MTTNQYIGMKLQTALVEINAEKKQYRILSYAKENILTADFVRDRLNLHVDSANVIRKVTFG